MTDRILKELLAPELNDDPGDEGLLRGVVIDTEATGLDDGKLVELAAIPFTYTALTAAIIEHGEPVSWLQDPGIPLPEECRLITRLTDDDVKGRAIDKLTLCGVVGDAAFLVAHNARFDRGIVERELPELPWATGWGCSMSDVDWLRLGQGTSRGLETLLMRRGWWYDGHRALADCWALLHLLASEASDGRTFFSHLRERAATPEYRINAWGSPFETKDALAARRYRWDAAKRVWWKIVTDANVEHEFLLALYGRAGEAVKCDWRMRFSGKV